MHSLVVLFSDANGWSSITDGVAAALARDGALVVGVDLPAYLRRLDVHTNEACHGVVGDIESISRQIQRERGNSSYRTPIVAGVGEGGSLAGVILAQAPAATLSGAVTYDPTASVQTLIPLCSTPAASADSGGGFEYGPWLAIVLSGDGGWRDVDKGVAEKLQSDAVSVIGWDSLRYFWSKKSLEQTARDLSAVIDTYVSRWGASKVALIGYSFGADVLPFAYNHLSPEAKVQVVQLSLLGFAPAADFEISIAGWLGAAPGKDALPTEPALALIDPTMIQCFYGAKENDSACPLISRKAEIIRTAGGHHFDNDNSVLARGILDGLHRRGE